MKKIEMKKLAAKFFMVLTLVSSLSSLSLANTNAALNPDSHRIIRFFTARYFTPDTINAALGEYVGFMSKLIMPVWWF